MAEENQATAESAIEKKISEKVAAVTASGSHATPMEAVTPRPTDTQPAAHDVSAATVARMLGLATATEVRLVESKLDLMSSKISTLQIKAEKMLTILNSMPTGGDLERIDVQLGSLKSLLKDLIEIKKGGEAK